MTPELDADRRLALAYAPASARPALEALWRLDVTLGAVLATGREREISRIRLAWWRESLEKLDKEPAPPEPVLQAVARHLLPAGIAGAGLAGMEEGWSALLSGNMPDAAAMRAYGEARGGLLFRYTAMLLGDGGHPVERAGARWALVDLARRTADPGEARATLAAAAAIEDGIAWPRRLRVLALLAMLARRDVARGFGTWERRGSPPRMMRMLRFRLTGR